jgi:hypothetical protein
MPTTAWNAPCHCGGGGKFKHCHGAVAHALGEGVLILLNKLVEHGAHPRIVTCGVGGWSLGLQCVPKPVGSAPAEALADLPEGVLEQVKAIDALPLDTYWWLSAKPLPDGRRASVVDYQQLGYIVTYVHQRIFAATLRDAKGVEHTPTPVAGHYPSDPTLLIHWLWPRVAA